MRAWIIAAGSMENNAFYRSIKIDEGDMVICADGGYDHAKIMGIRPDIIVGDLDSVSDPIRDNTVPVVKFPTDKDLTDTQIAVNYALKHNCDEIIFLGAVGGARIDHTIANIMLLSYVADRGAEGMILTSKNRISLVTSKMNISRGQGNSVSFIPITPQVIGITMSGFLYNLDNKDISMGDTITMSNEFRSYEGHISIESGKLLVICDV